MAIDAGSVSIDVVPNTGGFSTLLRGKLTAAIAGVSADVTVEPDTTGFREKLRLQLLGAMTGLGKNLKIDTASTGAALDKLKSKVGALGFSMIKLDKVLGIMKWPAVIGFVGTLLGGVSALAAGVVALSSTLIYASGSLVSLVASFVPLTGLLIAYPAILLAVVQGFLAVSLATKGVGEALKLQAEGGEAYHDALKKLNPAQAAFVKQMKPFREELSRLQTIASHEFLGPITNDMTKLKVLFPIIEDAVRGTGAAMAQVARKGISMVSSNVWQNDLSSITSGNVTLLKHLGGAALNAADGFRHILMSAQPLIKWLGVMIEKVTETFSAWAQAGRKSGEFAAFFERTKDTVKVLGPALMDVAKIILNVLKAAQPLGLEMLETFRDWASGLEAVTGSVEGQNSLANFFSEAREAAALVLAPIKNMFIALGNILVIAKPLGDALWASFGKITEGWVDFTRSVEGQNSIKNFFDAAQPVLHEIALLIGDIVKALGGLATNTDVANMIGLFRTKLLPVLVDIANTASGRLNPALVTLAEGFLRLFSLFGSESGVLVSFVDFLGEATNGLVDFLEKHDGMKNIVVTMVALSKIFQALGGSAITGAISAIAQYIIQVKILAINKALLAAAQKGEIAAEKASLVVRAASIIATTAQGVASALLGVAQIALAFATGGATEAMAAFNLVIAANPIGFVITAIVLVIAAIALLATKTKVFQTLWVITWDVITNVFNGVVNLIIDGVNLIIKAWNLIPFHEDTAMIGHIGQVKTAVEGLTPHLTSLVKLYDEAINAGDVAAASNFAAMIEEENAALAERMGLVAELSIGEKVAAGAINQVVGSLSKLRSEEKASQSANFATILGNAFQKLGDDAKQGLGKMTKAIVSAMRAENKLVRNSEKMVNMLVDKFGLSEEAATDMVDNLKEQGPDGARYIQLFVKASGKELNRYGAQLVAAAGHGDAFADSIKGIAGTIGDLQRATAAPIELVMKVITQMMPRGGLPGAAEGGVIRTPSIIAIAEKVPEIVMPLDRYEASLKQRNVGASKSSGAMSGSLVIENWETGKGYFRAIAQEEDELERTWTARRTH